MKINEMDKLILNRATVKQVIKILLDEPLDNVVVFKSGQKELCNIKVGSREPKKESHLLSDLFD